MRARNLREHNTVTVLRAVVLGHGSASRADIAAAHGLTRSTVSAIVDDLLLAGLITEGAPAPSGTGRPKIPLRTAEAVVGLGVEIAADRVRVVARALDGRTVSEADRFADVTALTPTLVAGLVAEVVGEVLAGLPPTAAPCGLTVSVPGRVCQDARTVISAPNLGWVDVDLVGLLEAHPLISPLAPRAANDSGLAARHEATTSPGASFVFLHGETGIGGAIVLDGQILAGENGWAGELGHVTVVPNGEPCGCGRRGCLEAYAGFHALRCALGLPEGTHIDELVAALEADDPRCRDLLAQVGTHVGAVLAGTLTVLDLSTVVLSGYFRTLAPRLEAHIQAALEARALHPGAAILPAAGQGRHEADGAAREALERFWADVTGWMARTT